MPYALDDNDNHILDENGEKIEYSISYIETDDWYKHKEALLIDDNGHFDTEDRHIIVKDGIQSNHAVCKRQLDEINNNKYSKLDIDNKLLTLENKITAYINNLKSQISDLQNLIRNDKINNYLPSNFKGNY